MLDVAIATATTVPEPDADQALLLEALRSRGLRAEAWAWDEPSDPWPAARRVIIRSTWNYLHRPEAFLRWVEQQGPRILNAPSVVRWNIHKRYLVELAAAGLPVVPTALIPKGSRQTLEAMLAERGWERAVLKPAVSAGSWATRRLSRGALSAEDQAAYHSIVEERDLLLQPYIRSVEDYGERSIIMIDGALTHAIRKSPRFFDGEESVTGPLPIADEEREVAERFLAAGRQQGRLLYGRVDLARDEAGRPMLMELELIEPSLFLDRSPMAMARLADAIARFCRES
ncbi:MAG: hypothetical protein U1E65_28135 [Myxococcota bacterium]